MNIRLHIILITYIAVLFITACSQGPRSQTPRTVSEKQEQLTAESGQNGQTDSAIRSNDSVAEQYLSLEKMPHSLSSDAGALAIGWPQHLPPEHREKYQSLPEGGIKRVIDFPLSTFSIDVDTGSYSNIRRYIQAGRMPPEDAVRIEEMLNYFGYDYPLPQDKETPFSIQTELGPTPWNRDTRLLHVGIQGYLENPDKQIPANLVFLIDVSGSMRSADKLGLLKSSLKLLVNQLGRDDTISLVSYAGSTDVVLEPTSAKERKKIFTALKALEAGGSTHGSAGIDLAYQQAESAFKKNGINRVILATDGDFNVGISDIESLKKIIEKKRDSGIELTTLGFGTGDYNDYLMEQLADTGNGNYAYIDTLSEAKKVLVDELSATLFTIARDVKIQIEFNPVVVSEYRLLGYSNRILRDEDFNNDKIDAGDVGSGHSVTALYEIALTGEPGQRLDDLRYRESKLKTENASNELAFIKLRYKLPGGSDSRLISHVINADQSFAELKRTSENFRFSAAVAAFGQQLRGAKYLESFSYSDMIDLASNAQGEDFFAYRREFVQLLSLAEAVDETD